MSDSAPTISDDYTGDVSPGGESQRRRLSHAAIVKTSVGPMNNNAYLVVCSATGESVLIDAANDASTLAAVVADQAPSLTMVVTTHSHPDHWQALEDIVGGTDVESAAHRLDAEPLPVAPTTLLDGGETLQVGRLAFDVVHLVGHTPGSVALALTDPADGVVHLFTGDSLFPGGVGKTDGPENFTSLLDDVETKIFGAYPDSTVVYPGHGADTTLGAERGSLPEWRSRGW